MIYSITVVQGKVDLADPKSDDDLRLDFEGIHVLSTGSIYAFAVSSGYVHIYIHLLAREAHSSKPRHRSSQSPTIGP